MGQRIQRWVTGSRLTGHTPGPSVGVCQRNPQVCGPGRCIPRPSGYTCACDSGFRLSPQATHCIGEPDRWGGRRQSWGALLGHLLTNPPVPSDIDECRRVPPPCAPGRCENAPGSFRCVCGPGFRAGPRATECLGEKSAPPSSRPHPCPPLLSRPRNFCRWRAAPVLQRFPKSPRPYFATLVPGPTPRLAPAFPSAPLLPLPSPAGPSRGGECLPYYCGTFLSDHIPLRSSLGPALSIFQTLGLAPSKYRTSSLPPPGPASVLQLPELVP